MQAIPPVKATTPSDTEMAVERIFDAPRELVWRAYTEPELLAKWWGRGNPLKVETLEVKPGGHWRFVEQANDGNHGFEGRFAEVVKPESLSQTFDYDGAPGHPSLDSMRLEAMGDGRTKMVSRTKFFTKEERDGMLNAGCEQGMAESYAALDKVLASLRS